ncbi:hypothetical protein ACN3XK_74740, partial [Actinomadura welshii]
PPGTARATEAVAGAHFAELPLGSITVNPCQPWEQALAELAEPVGIVGLLQPIVPVRGARLRAHHGRAAPAPVRGTSSTSTSASSAPSCATS